MASLQWGGKFPVVHMLLNIERRKDKEVGERCLSIR